MTTSRDVQGTSLAVPSGMDPVQWRIASYAAGLDFATIPASAFHAAQALLVDTVGVLLAAYPYDLCARLRTLAPRLAEGKTATVLGSRTATTPEFAAFVNATTARYLEANDVFARHKPGAAHGHPSDVIAPLLAVAESAHISGQEFLGAVVLAYEIYLRICNACHSAGFDATTFGAIAVAASASRMLRLSPEQIGHAVSMAATAHNILKQVRSDRLTPWKALAAGEAGRAGVDAALLAQAGIEGPSNPFLGSVGWCEHVAGKTFALEELGTSSGFLVCESRIKTRPARALTIAATLAAEKLAGRIPDVSAIDRIVVASYRNAKNGTKPEHWVADNRETADHSIPYCVAAALVDGELTPSSFDDAHLQHAHLRALIAKIDVVEDQAFTESYTGLPQVHRARVSVLDRDGQCVQAEAGGDEDDLASAKSGAWIERKFHKMAAPVLGSDRAAQLHASLSSLTHCDDVGKVIAQAAADVNTKEQTA